MIIPGKKLIAIADLPIGFEVSKLQGVTAYANLKVSSLSDLTGKLHIKYNSSTKFEPFFFNNNRSLRGSVPFPDDRGTENDPYGTGTLEYRNSWTLGRQPMNDGKVKRILNTSDTHMIFIEEQIKELKVPLSILTTILRHESTKEN